MSDPISATLTTALDRAPEGFDESAVATALATMAERRAALAEAGVRVDESPYLHFLRRFAAEPASPVLAASA
jgi:hypothetical protein